MGTQAKLVDFIIMLMSDHLKSTENKKVVYISTSYLQTFEKMS